MIDHVLVDEPQHMLELDTGDRLLFYTDANGRQLGTDAWRTWL